MTDSNVTVLIPTLTVDSFLESAVRGSVDDGAVVIVVVDGPPQPVPAGPWDQPEVRLVFTGRRQGAATAINMGLSHVETEYVARLDADDLTYRGRFGLQEAYLRANPDCVLVGARGLLVDANGGGLGEYPCGSGEDVRHELLRRNPVLHSSFFVRASDLRRVGGYSESCVRMQDYDLLLRLALLGRIAILKDQLVGYRVHGGQTSRKLSGFVALMTLIMRERIDLARFLGASVVRQRAGNWIYAASQLARYAGLRRAGYERAVRTST